MSVNKFLTTVAALATPPGIGALHIIRISGPQTYAILSKICQKKIEKADGKTQLVYVLDTTNRPIDQVVLVKFSAPKSYTGEDMVEINCHGNMLVVNLILESLVNNGAQLAGSGEFTKRAFLNSKIDLNQVGAILNLIEAKSRYQVYSAIVNLNGKISKQISEIRNDVFNILSEIEISIDYPAINEENEFNELKNKIFNLFKKVKKELKNLITISQNQKMSNWRVAIVGRSNAGKSSLLNAILNFDRVIVSDVAGTTRDTIEVDYFLDGNLITFIDTAGIHSTNDQIENLGIQRSIDEIDKADLIIHLIDPQEINHNENLQISHLIKNKSAIIAYSKKDLYPNKLINDIFISAKNNDLGQLMKAIKQKIQIYYQQFGNEYGLSSKAALNRLITAQSEIEQAIWGLINQDLPIDLIAEHARACYDNLSDILGLGNSELANDIFDNFCVGK